MLRELFSQIMSQYSVARSQPFGGHPLASMIRDDLPSVLRGAIVGFPTFLAEGSPGKGNWADAPWLAVFDPVVTETAQEGYYPVYLFSHDLALVCLSLNQGVTSLKSELGIPVARSQLQARSSLIRARLKGSFESRFPEAKIALGSPRTGSNLELYEYGHAFGKVYTRDALPSDNILAEDLNVMLELYSQLTAVGGIDEFSPDELGEGGKKDEKLEEARRDRHHRRIERNPKLALRAKEIHGHVCQVCSFDFSKQYGILGAGYIEAHHKVPLSELAKKGSVALSPKDDFAVVCANCHRMLHRKDAPQDFDAFVAWFKAQPSAA